MKKSIWQSASKIAAALVLNLFVFSAAHALQITSLSPQGEVTRIRQLVVRFDEPAVNFGNAQAAPPVTLFCSDPKASAGSARWVNEREWAFDFSDDLPPGLSCNVLVARDFKSPKNTAITGPTSYRFTTGGPFVQSLQPSIHSRIDENQYFLMQLNGEATRISLQGNVWCAVDGVGEKVPLKMIDGKERTEFLKSMGREKLSPKDDARMVTFACNRTLTPSAKVQIVYGKGVTTPSGISSNIERRFTFQVREPFAANFSCERESAQSACMPIRPMTLSFNAPITRKDAQEIKVVSDKNTYKPDFDADADDAANIDSITFKGPFPETTQMSLQLPAGLKDASGRTLRNASMFPLKVATGSMPPIAKFAASPFGIVERFAEPDGVAVLPVTIRNVTDQPTPAANAMVSTLNLKNDADIISWFRKVQRYDSSLIDRAVAARDVKQKLPPPFDKDDTDYVQTRTLSLLAGQANVKTLAMPKPTSGDPRAFEVVGIPLPAGFHVVEIASQKLGAVLLDERNGPQRTMYVRTTALVTNLAVHFKLGRENSVAWVTSLDKGLPVANAAVKVSACDGKEVASGTTDAQGIAKLSGLSSEVPNCTRPTKSKSDDDDEDEYRRAYFVSARDAKSDDLAFTWSDWTKGIESWRFNVPVSNSAEPDTRAHTVFDRTLLRAGETVSMKHFMRTETSGGFALPDQGALPDTLVITHQGTDVEYTQAIVWRKTGTGGMSAENTWQAPPSAKLGVYTVTLKGGSNDLSSGSFRVEEFRLPVFQGSVKPSDSKAPLIAPKTIPTDVQVGYVSGGPAVNLPVRVSALMRTKSVNFADHDGFSFSGPRKNADGNDTDAYSDNSIVVADKLPVTLDRNGVGKVELKDLPDSAAPRELLLEATYSDPNGEVQTIRSTQSVWPAGVIAGIKTEGWVSASRKMKFQALALDLNGKPRADVPLKVTAVARITTTSRKRMVGGFYAYDNKTETKDLGSVCSGKSDSRGLLLCETSISEAGEVELVATADDGNGRSYSAAGSVWVTRQGEMWFGGENTDRIDVLPEKKSYEPGETARFQVRMPFRFATALVSVEREGVIQTEVVKLSGDDPTVSVKVKPEWGPNVYISVMALRGRLRDVPWYSFFTWGYKAPREWWTAFWYEGKEYVAPTAMVDLSKPAYRIGLAEIRVGTKAHQIAVTVTSDKPAYPVRATSRVTIKAVLPDGKPAAGAEVALAAVDEALLELMPNDSWNLLEAMLQRRSWGVETSTAQMEIIGRRHYGRKAIPAGGGGGHSSARELLDTLLLWNPRVVLDAKGEAVVNVPLNDAITSFRIVAVADAGTGMFGTGQTSIRATQDLQIISGLPPLIREGDVFKAQITLRNTTTKAMKAEVNARATLLDLAKQTIDIPAGEAREVSWNVTAPSPLGNTRAQAILWEIEAKDVTTGSANAKDALKASQRIVPAIPVTVRQATLVQLESPYSLDVAQQPDAIAGRGGIQVSLQPKLSDGMPGVIKWFAEYPYGCLEQQTSKYIGMRDIKAWQTTVAQIPAYLDSDGLANYFPPRDGEANGGSDILTAYVLAASNEASQIDQAYAIPDAIRAQMEKGLVSFVEGRIKRAYWSPRGDLDVRKLAAIEALSRYGSAQARMIQSITIAPNQWPTGAVIDWFNILKRMNDIPQRDQKLAEASQILRARISYQGTRMLFSNEQDDYWWWLMRNGDESAARLLASVIDDPAWKLDLPRMATGLLARQQRGAWATTTSNLWGSLAVEKFSTKFESTPVTGSTKAVLGSAQANVEWAAKSAKSMFLAWPDNRAPATLNVTQQGSGKPWMTIQSLAAVPLKAPANAGYELKKTITAVEQATPGKYSRGDVIRVVIDINASTDMTWVVMSDPIPGGATILGTGLGRDSQIATQGQSASTQGTGPTFEERSFEAYRSYYQYLPKGKTSIAYTVRLNNVGDFKLPPSRVEAMYAPEMYGETPNANVTVVAP